MLNSGLHTLAHTHTYMCIYTHKCTKANVFIHKHAQKEKLNTIIEQIMIFELLGPLNTKGALALCSLVQGDNVYGP